jgi:hypothetical protein
MNIWKVLVGLIIAAAIIYLIVTGLGIEGMVD